MVSGSQRVHSFFQVKLEFPLPFENNIMPQFSQFSKVYKLSCEIPSPKYPVHTCHSAYNATSTKSDGVKIDGFLYQNFM